MEDEGNGRHGISGSPLGTMRFGKRTFNSPLGTMRFGKREYNKSPPGTMRFG
uniref:FMRFamide-related peptide 3 n=1 Tax=Heterodera glycines TaxID=51029 RepID=A0A977XAX8_HETGL|nr:FMRFamide-related peptide 3 precursor [Heterodera glycines]UXN84088.1 FMRFamide-related peptide 3 precursor [Heterodera glycines]